MERTNGAIRLGEVLAVMCMMARKLYYPAILIGALLLLLAVIIAVHFDTTADHAFVQQKTAIVETVSHLENGCLTCHQRPQTHILPLNTTYSIERRSITHPESHPSVLQADVDAQLVDLGARILRLPDTNRADHSRVMAAFLTVYHETRQTSVQNVSASLSLIDSLQTMLLNLERQASPNHLRSAEGRPFQSRLSAALVMPPGSSTALIYHALPFDPIILSRWALVPDTCELVMPSKIVFAVFRRGPPSDSAVVLFSGVGWETAIL